MRYELRTIDNRTAGYFQALSSRVHGTAELHPKTTDATMKKKIGELRGDIAAIRIDQWLSDVDLIQISAFFQLLILRLTTASLHPLRTSIIAHQIHCSLKEISHH